MARVVLLNPRPDWEPTPWDFPRGYAETNGGGILELKASLGCLEAQAELARQQRDGLPTLLFDPKDDRLYDMGMDFYGEFIASLRTGWHLFIDGMTFNDQPGTVGVAQRYMNGVLLKWRASE